MNDDLTQNLPGDKEPIASDADRIGVLIIAVQSLSGNVQSLSTAVQEIKEHLGTLETTVAARSLETKPIWERALAEIAETRAEIAETRAELVATRAEIAATRAEIAETKAELRAEIAETRENLRAEISDGFRRLSLKIQLLHEDSMTLRADQRQLEGRLDALDSKTP